MSRDADPMKMLTSIVANAGPDLVAIVEEMGHRNLTNAEREALRTMVAGELIDRGYRDDTGHNAYGVLLEDLIDWLGHQ